MVRSVQATFEWTFEFIKTTYILSMNNSFPLFPVRIE